MEGFQKYQHIQIEEVCCICFNKKEQMSFLSDDGLSDMLIECASIQVIEEDEICLVCGECKNEVSRWYVFKQQLVKSFEISRWLLKQKLLKLNSDKLSLPQAYNVKTNSIEKTQRDEDKTGVTEYNESWDMDVQSLNTNTSNFDCRLSVKTEMLQKNDIQNVQLNVDVSEEFTCKSCNKQFSSLNALQRHIKTHSVGKIYECPKCNKVFKLSQTLADHIRRHYDNRNFACEVCGKKFYKQFNVTEHMRIHTGERPFKCNSCNRTFTRALLLRNHIKKVMDYLREQPKVTSKESKWRNYESNYLENLMENMHFPMKSFMGSLNGNM